MAVYAVSFTIKNNFNYGERYSSFMEQIRITGVPWAETTSFCLVETPESIDVFSDRLYYQSKIYDVDDMVLVMDTTTQAARVRGPVQYPSTLQGMLPHVKKA